MKNLTLTLILFCTMSISCSKTENPFFEKYNTPHGTVPFNEIKLEHYEPAMMEGMRIQLEEIDAIINNPETPDFANTIEALECSGELFDRVANVFFNLRNAETNDDIQAVAQKMIPLISEHSNKISLNENLFARVKAVYEQKESLKLNKEQAELLEKTYDGFVRSGVNLQGEDKEKYKELTQKLSLLGLQFGENNLKEENKYELHITNKEELSGLPDNVLEAAAYAAQEKEKEGWIFTLQAPSYIPLMKYADNRELRKKLYMAYNTKCCKNDELNNEQIVKDIVNTEMEIVQLLGYNSYADYTLQKRMAENTEGVYSLLNQLLESYTPAAKEEVKAVEKLAQELEGSKFQLMPWDWNYYANKLMERDYSLNDEELRPYFELSKVKEGVFGLATKLYGITFKKNSDIQVYHPDVDAYEVFDNDGSFLAVLYTDFHPRAGKRSGAWMSGFKDQWIDTKTGENSRPHVMLVMNFTKPTADKPALLTYDEVKTFLHEFGHGLHGMFANTTYASMSGTSVYRDFVELPSQFMENYMIEKEFLNTFAQHYETGETLPDELIKKVVDSSNFNIAYFCLRQLSFGFVDRAWYSRDKAFDGDVKAFEKEAWEKTQLLPSIPETCMSTQFSHIFAGGYAAGYYSYKWAEVLDADAFSMFKEKGIFNKEMAQSFRENVLSKGGTEHPMELYKRFRGQEPTVDALLIRNGIK